MTHTWLEKYRILKMNVMPQLLYLFQTLQVAIPANFLSQLNQEFIQFLWADCPPGIKADTLTMPKKM